MHQSGDDPTAFKGQIVSGGVKESLARSRITAKACASSDENDPRLIERNRDAETDRIRTLIAVAVMDASRSSAASKPSTKSKPTPSMMTTSSC